MSHIDGSVVFVHDSEVTYATTQQGNKKRVEAAGGSTRIIIHQQDKIELQAVTCNAALGSNDHVPHERLADSPLVTILTPE